MEIDLLDPQQSAWPGQVDDLRDRLGAPHNPTLFPSYFLQAALPRLGGKVIQIRVDGKEIGVGFCFPKHIAQPAKPTRTDQSSYIVRLHPMPDAERMFAHLDQDSLAAALASLFPAATIEFYFPTADHAYQPTHQQLGDFDIGQPNQAEAESVRLLQQRIWHAAPDALYPADIHSIEFGLATSLVARTEGRFAGFLLGLHKLGGPTLPHDWTERFHGEARVESQLLGVAPEYRGRQLGFLLKRVQAAQTLAHGIQLINWTVDPLLYPNARLNFGLLRAVAFDFYANLYPFRNELNRVPASRFSMTWLIETTRVDQALTGTCRAPSIDLRQASQIVCLNHGANRINDAGNARQIAIEVPANWVSLQQSDLDLASQWRTTTDQIFQQYVGRESGSYVITDVGTDGAKCYLIGARATPELWMQLGQI